MEMNYCRRCGKALAHVHDHVYQCENKHTIYANHSPAVGIFFLSPDNREVLLATRGIEPHKGMLDAPGGYLDAKETFEEGAIRELHEELGLGQEDYEPFNYLTSEHDVYPYQGEVIPFVTVLFWTRLKDIKTLQASDDVASADWYPLAGIDLGQLHANDIRKGIRELQKLFKEDA